MLIKLVWAVCLKDLSALQKQVQFLMFLKNHFSSLQQPEAIVLEISDIMDMAIGQNYTAR